MRPRPRRAIRHVPRSQWSSSVRPTSGMPSSSRDLDLNCRLEQMGLHRCGDGLDDVNGLPDPLERRLPAVHEREVAARVARQLGDGASDKHLSGCGLRAQASGHVDRRSSVSTLDRNRLARVNSHPYPEWKLKVRMHLLLACRLKLDGRAHSLRGVREDGQRLVPAELDHMPSAGGDRLARDLGEGHREAGSGRVTVLLRERRIPSDIGDQEQPQRGVRITALRPRRAHACDCSPVRVPWKRVMAACL